MSIEDLDFQDLDEDFVNMNFDDLHDIGESRRQYLSHFVRDGMAVVDETGRYVHIPEVGERDDWDPFWRSLYGNKTPAELLRSFGRPPLKERFTAYGRYYQKVHRGMAREHERHGRVLISLFV